MVERDVDGECGGVMVRPQIGLSTGSVFHHKVHDSVTLYETQTQHWFKGEHFIQCLVKLKHTRSRKNIFVSKHHQRMSSFVFFFFSFQNSLQSAFLKTNRAKKESLKSKWTDCRDYRVPDHLRDTDMSLLNITLRGQEESTSAWCTCISSPWCNILRRP